MAKTSERACSTVIFIFQLPATIGMRMISPSGAAAPKTGECYPLLVLKSCDAWQFLAFEKLE
jgi:hypothetical protein